jgi:hypothetical protein
MPEPTVEIPWPSPIYGDWVKGAPLTPTNVAAHVRKSIAMSSVPTGTWYLARRMKRSQSSIRKYAKMAHDMGLIVQHKTPIGYLYFTPEFWMQKSKRRWDNSRYYP